MLYTLGAICLVFVYCSANIDPKIDASQAHHPFEDGEKPSHTHLHVDTDDDHDMDDEYHDLDDVSPDWNSLGKNCFLFTWQMHESNPYLFDFFPLSVFFY